MSDETYAYFFVEGFDCGPNEISTSLNFEPTESWMKGDISKAGITKKESCWLLYSTLSRSELFLDKHIEALVDTLLANENNLRKIVEKYDCGINCVGKFDSPNPGIHLSQELLAKLSKLNIPVDFDLYCNPERD